MDTAETSAGITASRLSNDLFAIRYSLYNTGDPRCCPTGGTDSVRFYGPGIAALQAGARVAQQRGRLNS